MLESYLITFREGVEISLIVGILLVYLRKINRTNLRATVFYGLGAAATVSVIAALILEKLALDFEPLEGYLMFAAAILVTTMIVWMWRTSKHIKRDIEHRIDSIVAEQKTSFGAYVGVFLFTFLMVVREGIETVIFLRAVSSGQGAWGVLVGVGAGVLAAIAFGVLFVKGSVKVDIGKFLKVTAVVLLVFVAQLVVNGIHEFFELGVFPASPTAMGIVGPIVRNNLLFILAIFSIPAIMFIIPPSRHGASVPVPGRRMQLATGLITLSVVFFFGFDYVFQSRSSVEISPPAVVEPAGGTIDIPVNDLLDGKLHRFVWITSDSIRIRFFALRTGTSSFGTAFDACRACYNYGFYYVKDGELICSLCEAPASMSNLATATDAGDPDQSGSMEGMGCAPIELPSRIENGSIVIRTAQLLEKKKFFTTSFNYKLQSPAMKPMNNMP